MKHALDARVAAAAGRAAVRLGSVRREVIANIIAEWATPWGAGAAAKDRRQVGHATTMASSDRAMDEVTAEGCAHLRLKRPGLETYAMNR